MKYENREISFRTEIRTSENDKRMITGVIPYNKESSDMGFVETIKPGAFTNSIKEGDVRALWNHDPKYILGRLSSGSLRFQDKADGLHFEIDVPESRQYALDAYDVVKSGDAEGVSFGFRVVKDTWTDEEGEPLKRDLLEVVLREVSIAVTFPAYPDSKAQARDFNEATGLDLSRLAKTMVRACNHKDITEEDRSFLDSVIGEIRKVTGSGEQSDPAPENSERSPAGTVLLRMELDLLEESIA